MSDCCGSSCDSNSDEKKSSPRKFTCPVNNEEYVSVSVKTILHHLKSPWEKEQHIELGEEQYYFCTDPECDVIYFGLNGSVITKSELRTLVGIKEKDEEALICYCFGVSKAAAKKVPEIKKFVTQKTKENLCACDTRNPSGRCCLKDFPKSFN